MYCHAMSLPHTEFKNGKYYINMDNKTIEIKYE